MIQIAGRLIAKQEQGLADEGARQRHALLLAAGKLGGAMVEAIAQANLLEQIARAVDGWRVIVRYQRRHQDVLEHGTLRQQAVVLKDESDCLVTECGQIFLG